MRLRLRLFLRLLFLDFLRFPPIRGAGDVGGDEESGTGTVLTLFLLELTGKDRGVGWGTTALTLGTEEFGALANQLPILL